ncbi:unnamed protein product [Meloidogyne enterolobii]|uniref:Uncharacterized protein n=1 Tax=Meloidogyne enterolobii TaxID=390850 RepID=A0ACB0YC89_MELEN
MKFTSFLIVLISITIFWTFVKTVSIRKSLARLAEKDYKATEVLNDGAESSVNPQKQKFNETLKPKLNNTKDTKRNNGGEKVSNRSAYNKEYYRKNKERLLKYSQNYYEKNKEKVIEQKRNYRKQNEEKRKDYQRNYNQKNKERLERNKEGNSQYMKIYYQKNRERLLRNCRLYKQNNREKWNEYKRKYRQKKKNIHIQSGNNEGTSFVNPQTGDFSNKGKLKRVLRKKILIKGRKNAIMARIGKIESRSKSQIKFLKMA